MLCVWLKVCHRLNHFCCCLLYKYSHHQDILEKTFNTDFRVVVSYTVLVVLSNVALPVALMQLVLTLATEYVLLSNICLYLFLVFLLPLATTIHTLQASQG